MENAQSKFHVQIIGIGIQGFLLWNVEFLVIIVAVTYVAPVYVRTWAGPFQMIKCLHLVITILFSMFSYTDEQVEVQRD